MSAPTPLRNWGVLMVRQVVMALATGVGLIVLGRELAASEFALYGYATLAFTVGQSIGDLGFGARTILGGDEGVLRHRAGTIALTWGAVVAVVTVALWAAVGAHEALVAALMGAGLLALSLQTLQGATLERDSRFGIVGIIESAQRVLFVVVAVVAVVAFDASGTGIAVAVSASGIAGWVAMGWARGGLLLPSTPAPLAGFASAWFQGRLANQLTYGAYMLLGPVLLSPHELGLVVWALSVSALPALGAALVARAVLPSLADTDALRHVAAYRAVFRVYLPLSLPFVLVLAVFAEPLTRIAFGERWLAAVPVLRLECATTAIGLLLTPIAPLLYVWLDAREARTIMVAFASATWVLALVYAAIGRDLYALSLASVTAAAATLAWSALRIRAATAQRVAVTK